MKIAVLTMAVKKNYGGTLQAYAVMEILKKFGHQPELLHVDVENKTFKSYNSYFKEFLKTYCLSYIHKRWKSYRPLNKKIQIEIEKNTSYFIDKYINPKTERIKSEKDFKRIVNDKYDAYVVGSDQVWRPRMYKYVNHAFFDFVKNPKAILFSYAASFGTDKWEFTEKETEIYKKQIKRFKGISVREDSGVELCRKYFNVKAKHVLDPTMLHDVEDYKKIIDQENEPSFEGGLLTYILDKSMDKEHLENIVAKELDLKAYSVNVKSTDVDDILSKRTYPTVTSWLKGFDDAKYVITDSFHGCAFAILFNKPFIVYGNEQRGMARFNSLLKMFELEDRLVLRKEDISIDIINKYIDWNNVNNKLTEYRSYSIEYLNEVLN